MTRLRLLSHNVYWFQGHPFDSKDPGDPNPVILRELAELHRSLEPDLICLQEIQSARAFRQAADAYALQGAYCPGQQLSQYGGSAFWRDASLVADARNATHPPQRYWQSIDAGTLRLCHVHLPSAAQLPAEQAARQRLDELRALLGVRRPPEVVVGDCNEPPGGGLTDFMAERDYHDAAEATGQSAATTYNDRRIDYIWVHGSARARLTGFGVVDLADIPTPASGKQRLSDHQPIWADFA